MWGGCFYGSSVWLQLGSFTLRSSCFFTLMAPHPINKGCAIAQTVTGFPLQQSGFKSRSYHVGFVVDKVELGQVFSTYFSFLY
jgi:hypothetical protein